MFISNRLALSYYRVWLVGILSSTGLFAQDYTPLAGYYAGAEDLLGESLRTALHAVIDGQNSLNYYNDLPILWTVTEAVPGQPGLIQLIYSGKAVSSNSSQGGWNREHTWPQSYGAGTGSAFSDAHHIFPADSNVNETRSNYIFDYVVVGSPVSEAPDCLIDVGRNIFQPRDEDKGLIARAQLYMDLRYDGSDPEGDLQLSDFPNSALRRFARLTTLLEWNRKFPPSERELMRNHTIYNGFFSGNKLIRQGNRNPFIDFPDLADAIHTSADFISYGSWRISHFSFDELLNSAISADLADPDEDELVNLFELSQNFDPLESTQAGLPEVQTESGSGARSFTFTRLKKADRSYLTYSVEYSDFPLDEASWQSAEITPENASIQSVGMLESIVFHGANLEAPARPRQFRLKVSRSVSETESVSTVFDPERHEEPDSQSLFLYAEDVDSAWKLSDWLGYVSDFEFPYVFHTNHKWLYVLATDDRNVFLYDPALGWLWTGYGIYPALYAYNSGKWIYHVSGTTAPDRWFIDYSDASYIQEKDL